VIVPTMPVLGLIGSALNVAIGDLFDADDPTDLVTMFAAEITSTVDRAPPLTADQKSQLRILLRGVA
jgi:hypothetical protein